ncbi:hypothetical protein Hdeb2414_s1216g00993551 [Helianthus debilis subsp. tardiflorus]
MKIPVQSRQCSDISGCDSLFVKVMNEFTYSSQTQTNTNKVSGGKSLVRKALIVCSLRKGTCSRTQIKSTKAVEGVPLEREALIVG